MLQILIDASYDTLRIVLVATIFSICVGGLFGTCLAALQNEHIFNKKYLWLYKTIITTVNFLYNIPVFLILIIMLPVSHNIFDSNISLELSTVIALTFIGILSFTKDVCKTLHLLPKELSETAIFLGAQPIQILTKFLLPEAMHNIINNISKLIIKLFKLSIIASALGVSGLGKLALEKSGYHDLETIEISYVIWTILLSTIFIYIIKLLNNYIININYNFIPTKTNDMAHHE